MIIWEFDTWKNVQVYDLRPQPKDQQLNRQQMKTVQFPNIIMIIGVMKQITLLLAIGMVEIVVVHNARKEYATALILTLEA